MHTSLSLIISVSCPTGFSQKLLREYEIITRNPNPQETSDDDTDNEEDDELLYAVARSVPFPVIKRTMDAVSASETEFPKLFHQHRDSATSESLSLIHESVAIKNDPLDVDWVTSNKHSNEVQNVYRKVANWVASQHKYFRQPESIEDDIEVIDPIDLFHHSLLEDFLLLTRSSSEKRILLRDFSSYSYNMLTVKEATRKSEFGFLRKPGRETSFEMSVVTDEREAVPLDDKQPFVAVETILHQYAAYDREGSEIFLDDCSSDDTASSSDEEISMTVEEKVDDTEKRSNELDIMSYQCSEVIQPNRIPDDHTSITFPTDVFEITTAFAADMRSESDENESDVWEDAKSVPHWLDFETEDHLFSQPHRPFYYYRDRIKGCYRIVGVEDETVILFSGNDDDSIFYGCENEERNITDMSALRRSHSLGLLGSSINRANDSILLKPSPPNVNQMLHSEKKNDSGIEDAEDSVLDETLVETTLSAKQCHEIGWFTKVINSKETKTVTFNLGETHTTLSEYLFVICAVICFILSLILALQSNSSQLLTFY